MKFNIKSRKGFTLIELLVVIGILAVLVAIAIPSVAGLIDRANQSADATNANEMTNAIERFTSEYELYCQDVASGGINTAEFDSMQGRVYNVTGIRNRTGIEAIESVGYTNYVTGLDRDTKYPVNEATVKKVIENYMKTSSSTFEPKQSDCSYYYSPQIGKVVVAPTGSTASEIDAIAKANGADYASVNNGELIEWINLSINAGEEQKDWNYNTFASDTKNVYTGYTTNAKYFNVIWTTEDQNGNPLPGVSHHIKISNSYHEAECDTPGTMNMVPAGNYALRIEDGTWYYDYNILIYREGVQKFTLDTPSGKITIGTGSDEKPAGSTPTPEPPVEEPPAQQCTHQNTEVRDRVEATTSANGYTGDTWCKDCNTKIASGNSIPKLTSTVKLGFMHFYEMTAPYYTFEFVEGMTWNQFVNSQYNVARENGQKLCDIDENGYVVMLINMPSCPDEGTNYVKGTDVITYPANYVHDYTTKKVSKHYLGSVCQSMGDHHSEVTFYKDLAYCPRCADLFTGWIGGNYYENGVFMMGCFAEGSQVLMADGTTKNIEDVLVGERVMSYNSKTGEFYITNVIATTEEVSSCYFVITLDDGTEIKATANHPFLTDKGFENIIGSSNETHIVDKLSVGDKIFTTDGYKVITTIERVNKKTKVYNLNVADDDEIKNGTDNDEDDTFVVEGAVNHNHSGGSN